MLVSITEAARLAGVSRSTIQRALKSGRLSKSGDGVDTSELARVWPNAGKPADAPNHAEIELVQLRERARYLEQRIADLERQIAEQREDKRRLMDALPLPWWRRLVGPKS